MLRTSHVVVFFFFVTSLCECDPSVRLFVAQREKRNHDKKKTENIKTDNKQAQHPWLLHEACHM